jgi:hypothetical protein
MRGARRRSAEPGDAIHDVVDRTDCRATGMHSGVKEHEHRQIPSDAVGPPDVHIEAVLSDHALNGKRRRVAHSRPRHDGCRWPEAQIAHWRSGVRNTLVSGCGFRAYAVDGSVKNGDIRAVLLRLHGLARRRSDRDAALHRKRQEQSKYGRRQHDASDAVAGHHSFLLRRMCRRRPSAHIAPRFRASSFSIPRQTLV